MNALGDSSVKSERLNLRLTSQSSQLIREAAVLSGQDVTSFVINAALERARAVIMEDSVVRLSASDAQDLAVAVDREAVPVPQLVELLRRAGEARSADVSDSIADLVG